MITLPPTTARTDSQEAPPPLTATDAVFEKLLEDIVSGTYPAKARLPAERDLAKQLGASRPTLREALRRLGEWNLVKPRRGSGIAVRDRSEWMIEVFPSYLRFAEPGPDRPATSQMVNELLQLRRALTREILSMVASRVPGTVVAEARNAVRVAWEVRASGADFAVADMDILRTIVSGCNFLPGLWMLNSMCGIYKDLASSLGSALAPPESYLAAWDQVLGALAAQDAKAAVDCMDQYLAGHDERLLALLELMA